MTNLKLNIATIIFAIFALTSCQKETMSELNPTIETTNERGLPAAGIHIYNETAKTLSTRATRANKATARERNFTTISADAGPIFDDTKGEGNFIDKTWGACLADYPWDFKGEDNVYIFEVVNQPEALVTHHVTISDLQDDLDLFVYTLDENNYVRDCKAISMNGGMTAESVDMQGLEAGFYIIVVDGWAADVASTYNLEFYTSAVSANPPTVSGTDNLSRITTTETTFSNIFGQWYDELEPPHFATPYGVVASSMDSLTIERTQVEGNTEITQTFVFDLANDAVTAIETRTVTSNHGTTMTSSYRLAQIVEVTYDESEVADAVSYSSVEFAALGTTTGIGAFAQQTDIEWYEYAFSSDAEHHFEEVSRDATAIN